MLKTRIITALVLLPIVLVALFIFPNWAWDIFTLTIAIASCWEWSRFCKFSVRGKQIYSLVSAVLCAIVFFAYLDGRYIAAFAMAGFVLAAAFWLIAAPFWLAKSWRPGSLAVQAATGWIIIFPTWLAFLALHDKSPWLLLTFAIIVWVADVSAYAAGKTMGKHKLAPAISPGKTIEGVVGGLVGVTVYFFLWRMLAESGPFQTESWAIQLRAQGAVLFGFFILLGVLSVLGDLFESWMKRGAGLKDSSNLLPGHGGVLDRIDALTSTLPVVGLYVALMVK